MDEATGVLERQQVQGQLASYLVQLDVHRLPTPPACLCKHAQTLMLPAEYAELHFSCLAGVGALTAAC